MTNTLIYIYGSGVDLDIERLKMSLEEGYCLTDITDKEDAKIRYEGEGVYELLFSKTLDYIKLDADCGVFESLIYDFSQLLKCVKTKHVFSLGLSGDPADYRSLPNFESEQECIEFFCNTQNLDNDLPS